MQVIDLTGQKFGRLTVIDLAPPHVTKGGQRLTRWRCVCDCGKVGLFRSSALRRGETRSCGCLVKDAMEARAKDEIGKRYGRLTVIARATSYVSPNGRKAARWLCACDCGDQVVVRGEGLRAGKTVSCGCNLSEWTSARFLRDLVGQRFTHWVVIARIPRERGVKGSANWLCRCDCGTERSVSAGNLRAGISKSCGCMTFGEIVDLPHAVYRLYDDAGDLLYIGLARDIDRRFYNHAFKTPWWDEVASHTAEWFPDRATADAAETAAIRAEKPPFNRQKLGTRKRKSQSRWLNPEDNRRVV